MKNKILKKLSILALLVCLIFALSGCGTTEDNSSNSEDNENPNTSQESNKASEDDLKVFDYIEEIDPENTVEEINEIIGAEGELIDEEYNKYEWEITEDTTLTATYYSSTKATLNVSIDDDLLKDDYTDLSSASDLKAEINSTDGVKYDDFAEKFGTDGYLIEKSSSSKAYRWVNSDGGYIKATFSDRTGKCTSFFGSGSGVQ